MYKTWFGILPSSKLFKKVTLESKTAEESAYFVGLAGLAAWIRQSNTCLGLQFKSSVSNTFTEDPKSRPRRFGDDFCLIKRVKFGDLCPCNLAPVINEWVKYEPSIPLAPVIKISLPEKEPKSTLSAKPNASEVLTITSNPF